MNTPLPPRADTEESGQSEDGRKTFTPPKLETYDTLPKLTGASGDLCESFGLPPGCELPL
jgi:hypothetical protein